MRNGGRLLLAALNLYVRTKIPRATFDTSHSVKYIMQTMFALVQKLPDSLDKSAKFTIDSF